MIGQTAASHYRIVSELGRGGMGVVYKALDTETNTYVAIKTVPPELAHHREFLLRFQQEARALMRLHHPHVVGLIDLVQDQGSHYMVLEYVDGPSLSQLLAKGPLPPERARQIALEVADALRHAHGHDIVHRDIKPGNILLTREGQVKVTDFGIARILDATLGTLTGQVFGTARYASPEQVKGLKVDARSDIYSLGVVLYEMLTGRPPFLGTDDEVMEQHNAAQPVPPSELNEGVPASLEAITLRCLEKDRGSRHQSAGDLAAALRGGRVVKEPAGGEKVGGHRGRWKLAVAFAVIAVAVLMGLATLSQVVWPWFGGGRDNSTVAVGSETTPAGESAATGTASQGPAVASETEPPVAVPTEAAFVPTPTPFVGKIAFLSDRDHGDVEPLNSWRPVELYLMNPDGSDQHRLTSGGTPLSEVGSGGRYLEVRRLLWMPGEDRVAAILSAAPDVAAIFSTSDGRLDQTVQFASSIAGQEMLALFMDWSADGERVVFTATPKYQPTPEPAFSLWVADSDGGNWRQVLPSVNAFGPVWSPTGEWIAFSMSAPKEEAGLYVVHPDGSGLHLVAQGVDWDRRAWSPDGTLIASEKWDGHDIMLVDLGSGLVTNLTNTPGETEGHPTWSPDGRQIALQLGWGSEGEIWIMNADGSDAHKIAEGCCPAWQPKPPIGNDAPLSEPSVAWSPTTPIGAEGRIAFISGRDGQREIYRMKPDGSGLTRLTYDGAVVQFLTWSPDGNYVAFESARQGNDEIYRTSADGDEMTRLTFDQATDRFPAWSPDGNWIAFVSNRDGSDEIYKMRSDGSEVTRLTFDEGFDWCPTWSPDGKWIAFERGNGGVYKMKADGSGLACLTPDKTAVYPSWSPDGEWIAFRSNREGNSEIYKMRADGSEVTRLTWNELYVGVQTWSPDGNWIVFESDRSPGRDLEIYKMRADGSEVSRLTHAEGYDGRPAWGP